MTQWDERYSVGVKQFDDEHKRIFELVQELGKSIVDGTSQEKLGKVLVGIVEYADMHFASEERLMKKHGYPELDEHIVEHEKFAGQITDFQEQWANGRAILTAEVLKTLIDWLHDHMLNTDAKYGPFFNSKGIY